MLNATFLQLIRRSKSDRDPTPTPLARLRAIAQAIEKLGEAIPPEVCEDGQIPDLMDTASDIHAVIEEMEGSSSLRICQQCGYVSGVDPDGRRAKRRWQDEKAGIQRQS